MIDRSKNPGIGLGRNDPATEALRVLDEAVRGWGELHLIHPKAHRVIETAQAVGDSNFRRLSAELRKHGWREYAEKVDDFRKALEDYNQTLPVPDE
jgi:hypothetical protein